MNPASVIGNHGGGHQNINTSGGSQYNNERGPQFNCSTIYSTMISIDTPKVDEAKKLQEEKEECFRSLCYRNIDARKIDISSAHPNTCDWFFDNTQFQQWVRRDEISNHNGVLWIKGNPGTGKSTLMKHTLKHCEDEFYKKFIIIAHFFNARGDRFEHTPLGMLRSLLYQLLEKEPSIYERFIPIFRDKRLKHGSKWEWQDSELKEFLLSQTQCCPKPLLFLIDALDECKESQVRDVVKFLEDLSIKSKEILNICISSRHYPNIRMEKHLQLVMETTTEHDQDIITYAGDKLRRIDEDIKKKVIEKASGVFMWVVLVTEMLNKAYDEGQMEAMYQTLHDVPSDLGEVFRTLLSKKNPKKQETLFLLQFVLFTRRLLRPEELYFAMIAELNARTSGASKPSNITLDDIQRRITHSSLGLIEIREGGTVQFIHESVKDFLILNKGLRILEPELESGLISGSHERLRSCCMSYITKETSQPATTRTHVKLLESNYPFLDYASTYLFSHAEESDSIAQAQFLQRLKEDPRTLERIRVFHNTFEEYTGSGCAKGVSLLYMLAFHGYNRLTKILLKQEPDVNAQGGLFGTALQVAAAKGQEEIITTLLENGADINAQGGIYGTALQTAAAIGMKRSIILLIEKGADINARGGYYCTALQAAPAGREEEIINILLKSGADINARGGVYNNVLQAAAAHTDKKTVAALLAAGANVNAKGGLFHTALQAAAATAQGENVALLLEKRADVNAQGGLLHTALQAAVHGASNKIVAMLLDAGAKVNTSTPGGAFGTALQAAIYEGKGKIKAMLLKEGATSYIPENFFGTALQKAMIPGGDEKIIDILSKEGVNYDTQYIFKAAVYKNILKSKELIEMLLKEDINAKSQLMFDTALYVAASQGMEASVIKLLEKGANASAYHRFIASALVVATVKGNEEVMAILLENGAKITLPKGWNDTEVRVQVPKLHIYLLLAPVIGVLLMMLF